VHSSVRAMYITSRDDGDDSPVPSRDDVETRKKAHT